MHNGLILVFSKQNHGSYFLNFVRIKKILYFCILYKGGDLNCCIRQNKVYFDIQLR